MAQNKVMVAKHAKARREGMKAALYISGKATMTDIRTGRFTPPKDYVHQYFLKKEV